MNKIINLLNQKYGNVNQAAFVLAFFAFFSQILGMLRDRALAHFLGPSASLDIYYAAFRIPDFLFISIASLASIYVLLPFLVDKLRGSEIATPEAHSFFNQIFTLFLAVMIGSSVIIFFLMPLLAPLIAPGFSPADLSELVTISRFMLLSPVLLGLSNLIGSITQLFKKFFVFALSPVFYNVGILFGIIFLYPLIGLKGMAIGVIIGAGLHFAIQLPVVIGHKFIPRFTSKFNFKELKKMVAISLPRTLGLSVNSFALLAIVAMASFIGEGSISVFNFSFNLQAVPLTLVGASYSVAAFPTLAQFFSKNNIKGFVQQITHAAKQIIFWSMPIMFLFIILRAQIVRVVLGSGSFTWDDTRLTAATLALFSISIVGHALILLLVRGYYAAGKTTRPVVINVFSAGLIVVFAFIFLKLFQTYPMFQFFIESLFRVDDIPGTGILMMALAYSVGTLVNFFLLWTRFKKDFLNKEIIADIRKTFFQTFAAAFFIGFVSYVFLLLFSNVFDLDTFWGIFLQGFLSGIIGIAVGVVILKLFKNEQIKEVQDTLRTRFWKSKKYVVPSQEDL
ncbi:hypothetical protein COB64_03330 [Candidatus Wolfebacteria bacterium]|nr:MAG: hypothetical protein COB64_03330 [Candidatus Wolfebacteria bacterium]